MLSLIGEGMTNRGIAESMLLAEKTVKNYVSSMLAKLGLQCRTQAAVFAARHMPELPDVDATLTQPGSLPIRCRNPCIIQGYLFLV